MAKTLIQIDQQVRELIGDYQRTNFSKGQVTEAINWGQNVVMRVKGFKVGSTPYLIGNYPTGTLPVDVLSIKRVYLFEYLGALPKPPSDLEVDDDVVRILDESTMQLEDSVNERWRKARMKFWPRRWTLIGNQQFSVVPPLGPLDGTAYGYYVRVVYVKMATPMVDDADEVDASIPDYYHDAIRYVAVAYLMEKDTDQKSTQLKALMLESFTAHMADGTTTLARTETDS